MLRKLIAAAVATLALAPAAMAASWGTGPNPTEASWGTGTKPTAALGTTRPLVYVANLSTTVPQADVDAALPAFQLATSRDFAASWGTDAVLTTDPALAGRADMIVNVEDYATCMGCLGFHDVIDGKPTSRVFAATGADYHESWQLTFTHELFEMLADPWINRFAQWSNRFWLVEVGDPVESGFYAYKINGVVISDFITPRWYDGRLRGRFDFTNALKRPGQIARHGYASYWTSGGWKQVFG